MKLPPAACSVVLLAFPMLAIAATSARADVLVVDAGGSGNYTQIQAAVDAALDGDTILVKSGSYLSFVVANKALSIVGDASSVVHVVGAIRARNLAAGKTLVFENLNAIGAAGNTISGNGLFLSNNQGHVRVESCSFIGLSSPPGTPGTYGYSGIQVQGCDDVVLTRTSSLGGSGGLAWSYQHYQSGSGVFAQNSVITIYDSTLRGGTGVSAPLGDGGSSGGFGGDGARVGATTLFASGSSFPAGDGGAAGWGLFLSQTFGGDGGNGITLQDGSSAVLLGDIELGGHGGAAGGGSSDAGPGGLPRVANMGSTFTDLPGTSKHFAASTPVRESASVTMSFSGTPGDQVRLVIARSADYQLDLAHEGVNLLANPTRVVNMGIVPASGVLNAQVPAPAIGPNTPAINLQLQARFTDAQGNTVLSGPSSLVILNQAY